MTENERIIRDLYQVAEVQNSAGFAAMFSDDGYFWDVSAGQKYYGADVGKVVDIYAKAFPDMHRALEKFYVTDDVVIVELSLNGTHKGPLALSFGNIPPTGKEIHAPCCDVFHLENGKVKSFHCYTAATIMMAQLEVIGNLQAAMAA